MPASKEEIDLQLKNIGDFGKWFTKKEIKHLPEVLDKGEIIKAITSGMYDGTTWLIVVTEKRILFLDKGMIYGLKQVEIPIRQVSAISHKTGLIQGTIEISSSAGHQIIKNVLKTDAVKIARIISDLVESKTNGGISSSSTQTDVVSQLERLAALRSQGVLSEEEFRSQKARLMA
jgi:hypothetical protein